MSLAERQTAFMRAILDESAPLPEGWGNSQTAGMSVYRGNYRHALMSTLANTYERTAAYMGEGAFRQASINHVIANPPSHWTIDAVGEGFDATCAELFRDNPEVAELAWLEWAMLELATAPDVAPVNAQDFSEATGQFGDEDWMALKVTTMPDAAARLVEHDLDTLWRSLSEQDEASDLRPGQHGCIAWREGERPTFLMVEPDSARAFAAMQSGASYGEVIALLAGEEPDDEAIQDAAMRAGGFLGQWLQQGMLAGLNARSGD